MNSLSALTTYYPLLERHESTRRGEIAVPARNGANDRTSECTAHPNTVAIVEDIDPIAKLYAILLKREGYEPVIFSNGEDACEWMARNQPAVVICDIMLPGINGHEVLEFIRSTRHGRVLPVIAVSALATKGERERFLAAGFTDYLAKPINAATFAAAVRQSVLQS